MEVVIFPVDTPIGSISMEKNRASFLTHAVFSSRLKHFNTSKTFQSFDHLSK